MLNWRGSELLMLRACLQDHVLWYTHLLDHICPCSHPAARLPRPCWWQHRGGAAARTMVHPTSALETAVHAVHAVHAVLRAVQDSAAAVSVLVRVYVRASSCTTSCGQGTVILSVTI